MSKTQTLILLLPSISFIAAGVVSLYCASPFGPTEIHIHEHMQAAITEMAREIRDGKVQPTPEKLFTALTNSYNSTDQLRHVFARGHSAELRCIATTIFGGVVAQIGAVVYVGSKLRKRNA
jgi:hypothetical protein